MKENINTDFLRDAKLLKFMLGVNLMSQYLKTSRRHLFKFSHSIFLKMKRTTQIVHTSM